MSELTAAPGQALTIHMLPAAGTADWESENLALTREAIATHIRLAMEQADEMAKLITGSDSAAAARHAESQRAAAARHAEREATLRALQQQQIEAVKASAEMPVHELALHIVSSLPPGLTEADEAAIVARRVALVRAYARGAVPPVQTPAPPPELVAPIPPLPQPVKAPPALAMLTREGFAQMRGFNSFDASRGTFVPESMATLRATGANHARVWFSPELERTSGGPVYLVPVQQINRLKAAAAYCEPLGLRLVLVCQVRHPSEFPWGDDARMTAFVDMWIALAREFTGAGVIAGFDLMNEPTTREHPAAGATWTAEDYAQVQRDWRSLALACVGAIRAVDPDRICVYQMGLGGDPSQFEGGLPLPFLNVWESAHVYHPHSYTHQHAHTEVPTGLEYLPYTDADRATLLASQERMARWADRHGRGVYYGEFSATRYAPGASEYVRDVVAFAAARGWPWSYHDWRGWPGWDAELTGPPGTHERSATAPTLTVLREHLAPGIRI